VNRRNFFQMVGAASACSLVPFTVKQNKYRWRRLDEELPPEGSLVDLHTKAPTWESYSFGKRTVFHEWITPCGWNDGEKGILVLDPKITKWRYS